MAELLQSAPVAFHQFVETLRTLNGPDVEVVALVLQPGTNIMTHSTIPPEAVSEIYALMGEMANERMVKVEEHRGEVQ